MSFVKAKKELNLYLWSAADQKKAPAEDGYLSYWINQGKVKSFQTLVPGQIYSKPFVKKFKDKYGNIYITTQPYNSKLGKLYQSYIKAGNESDFELTGNVLTEDEQKKADKEKDESFVNKALKAGTSILTVAVVAAVIGALVFFGGKSK